MNKIPVGRTIAQSYGFAFGHYFTLFGIVWLPMLLSAALTYYLRGPMHEAMIASLHVKPGQMMPQFQQVNLLLQCVGLIIFAVISVGITKAVLGLPRGPKFFYVGFGAAEIRVIVGYFAYLLLFIVFITAFVIAIFILAAIAKATMSAEASQMTRAVTGLAILVLFFIAWLALIYVMVRLTFLFLPVTVAERRIGIMRSWELTAGNFWRIFAIGIVVSLPLLALAVAFSIALFGTDYFAFAIAHANDPAAIQDHIAARMEIYWQYLPYVMGGLLLINPIIYGLIISPASFAYRALVPLVVEAAPMSPPEAKKEEELPKVIEGILDKPSDHGEDEKH